MDKMDVEAAAPEGFVSNESDERRSSGNVSIKGLESSNPRHASIKAAAQEEQTSKDGCLTRASAALNNALSQTFHKIGYGVASAPWITVVVCLLLSCALGYKLFTDFVSESQPENLFVPQGTRSLVDKADVVKYYGRNTRLVTLVASSTTEGGNVLTKDGLLALWDVLDDVRDIEVEAKNDQTVDILSLEDLCVKIPLGGGIETCSVFSPLVAWRSRLELESDPDPVAKIQNDPRLASSVGGIVRENNVVVSAAAYRVVILLKNQPKVESEKAPPRDRTAEAWEGKLTNVTYRDPDGNWTETLSVYPQSTTSFVEEVGGAIVGDVGIVSASYMIIIVFVIVVLQRKCDRVFSSVALALLGFLTIGISILSAYGLAQLLGFKYGNTHSILPFIVLGVGSDSIFILVNAFRRTSVKLPTKERAAEALSHSGASLSVSSLTNVAAFLSASLTSIPDLASFGKYAAFALLFLYIYSVTFFMACIVLDERRMTKNKIDVLCCLPDCRKSEKIEQARPAEYVPGRLSRWMRSTYAPLITSVPFRVFFLVLSTGFLGFCAWKASSLQVEATGSNFLPSGSYVKTNFDLQARYFGGQPTAVQVVVKNVDPIAARVKLLSLDAEFKCATCKDSAPNILPDFGFWPRDFQKFLQDRIAAGDASVAAATLDDPAVGTWPKSHVDFFELLSTFTAGQGARYKADIIVSKFSEWDGKTIERFQIPMQHAPIGEFVDGVFKENAQKIVVAVDRMYEICDGFAKDLVVAYPYAFQYTDAWASFKIIKEELIQNTAVSLICVLVVVFMLIGNPFTSLLVFFSVVVTCIELLGMNAIMGFAIDTVVSVLVILSVGLAVDYSAHVAYEFMTFKGTRAERMAATLEDVGVPVILGCISTFLAVCLQSLSKSYVFVVVFYEFLFAISFGAINGIILLPVLLSWVGPRPYSTAQPAKKFE